MTAVASRVEGGRRFGEVIADDARIADLLVAARQLVVTEADGARIVRTFGVFQRARVQRDRARLLSPSKSHAAVQAPQRRQSSVGHGVSK